MFSILHLRIFQLIMCTTHTKSIDNNPKFSITQNGWKKKLLGIGERLCYVFLLMQNFFHFKILSINVSVKKQKIFKKKKISKLNNIGRCWHLDDVFNFLSFNTSVMTI